MGRSREMETKVEMAAWSGKGEVWSFTTVYDAPERFVRFVPYTVALVKLEEGPLVTTMLTDVDNKDVHIGMKVEVVIRLKYDLGDGGLKIYGYKFRPVMVTE